MNFLSDFFLNISNIFSKDQDLSSLKDKDSVVTTEEISTDYTVMDNNIVNRGGDSVIDMSLVTGNNISSIDSIFDSINLANLENKDEGTIALKGGHIINSDGKIIGALFDDLSEQILFISQEGEIVCVDYSDNSFNVIPCDSINFLNI